ncbi:MAG: hypothetical protein PHY73_04830 [Candidatus Omnitrophica bacterium]|nr:hypothetical protein [Candidatus Omnitrophota bacterium]
MKKIILAILFLFFFYSFSYAGGVVAMKQQQAAREAAMQQGMMEQQMMQQAAVQGTAMQQAAVQAVQGAAIQQAVMQQAIIDQQIMQGVAMQQAAVQGAAMQQAIIEQQLRSQGIELEMDIPIQKEIEIVDDSEIVEVADMSDVLTALETSSKAWPLIADIEPKLFIVASYIDFFREKGVIIKKSPEFYVDMIDGMAQESPQMLENPFEFVLQVLAIIEYDFDAGIDKDEMALKILGPEGFKSNKQRFTQP